MRHLHLIALLAAVLLLVAACDQGAAGTGAEGADEGTAQQDGEDDVAAGDGPAEGAFDNRFNLIAMAHSSPETVRGLSIEVDTTPWDRESTGGPFSYASAPCDQDAPINNVSSNLPSLNTQLEGSRSPASTRLHPIEFEILSLEDGEGEMEGTIDLTVCQPRFGVTPEDDDTPDEERDRIVFTFSGTFVQPTPEETTWSGEFEAAEATGAYEGLQAEGQIGGYFMCLGPDPCEEWGEHRDAQVVMIGTYQAPDGAVEGGDS